jgi:hypothetical protein
MYDEKGQAVWENRQDVYGKGITTEVVDINLISTLFFLTKQPQQRRQLPPPVSPYSLIICG